MRVVARWFSRLFPKKEIPANPFAHRPLQMPAHVAIIMDGNGRWAERRGLPRIAGHRMGVEVLRDIVRAAAAFGIKYLTVYAFSTENWRRPEDEVDFLMTLMSATIDREIEELNKNKVRLRFLGRTAELPPELLKKMRGAESMTEKNSGLNLNVMINYGGRAEIIDAVNKIVREAKAGKIDEVTEEQIRLNLYTADIPDPDLLIRTASEMRLSNFLLWQIAYAELFVTPTLWPDFDREEFIRAIKDFQKRQRRFGKV